MENPNKIFYTGQSIKGYVYVALKSEQVIRNIFVRIDGVASTNWDLGRIVRCSKDDFLNHQMSVLNFDERRLLPRNHKFPFQFALPQQLPSSFESKFGVVRYSVKVLIEIPFEPTRKVEEKITVIKLVDFDDSDLQMTFYVCKGFNPYFVFSCLPWFPIKIDAHIKPAMYSPGTTIDIGVNVNNRSFRRIRNFLVELIKEVKYSSTDHVLQRKSIAILNGVEMRGCKQNQKHTICLGCQIEVPQTSPSDLSSNIIKIRHFIRITAFMGRSYRPTLELPVTIVILPESQPESS